MPKSNYSPANLAMSWLLCFVLRLTAVSNDHSMVQRRLVPKGCEGC